MPRVVRAGLPPGLLALTLGLVRLARDRTPWYDENVTLLVVRRPMADVLDLVRSGDDVSAYLPGVQALLNGPYYLLARAWTALPGVDPTVGDLRLLSVLTGACAVGVLARLVATVAGDRRVGRLAAVLLACSPLAVDQLGEARPYGVTLLATALAADAVVRRRDRRFLLAATAAGCLHWFAAPAVLGLGLGAALVRRSRRPLLLAALAGVLPAALVVRSLRLGVEGGGYLEGVGLAVPWQVLTSWSGGTGLLAAVALWALTRVALRRPATPLAVLAAGWLLLPVLLVTAVELVRPVYVPRYLLAATPALAALVAAGLVGERARVRGLGATLALAGCALVVPGAVGEPSWERGDDVISLLTRLQRGGEPVVAVEGRSAVALDQLLPARHRLRDDLLLPPQDAPAGPAVVWLVRQRTERGLARSDDDALLRASGHRIERTWGFPALKTHLVVQRWVSETPGA